MMLQVLPVAIFVWLFSQISCPHPKCEKPALAKTFNLAQIHGVWYQQSGVNYDTLVYDLICDRTEFFVENNTTAIVVKSIFHKNGKFTPILCKITKIDQWTIRFQDLTDPSISLDMFLLFLDEKAFVTSVCIYKDSKLDVQLITVQTKDQIVTKSYLQELMEKVNVEVMKVYYFDNREYCYNLTSRCRSG